MDAFATLADIVRALVFIGAASSTLRARIWQMGTSHISTDIDRARVVIATTEAATLALVRRSVSALVLHALILRAFVSVVAGTATGLRAITVCRVVVIDDQIFPAASYLVLDQTFWAPLQLTDHV
jgi:hypothetical protein